jgi:hypothetical protein
MLASDFLKTLLMKISSIIFKTLPAAEDADYGDDQLDIRCIWCVDDLLGISLNDRR